MTYRLTLEGFDSVGIESEAEYLPLIEGRVAWAAGQDRSGSPVRKTKPPRPSLPVADEGQGLLFGEAS